MYDLLKEIESRNPERFNEDFINLKDNDQILTHINAIFEAMEVINGVKFLGSEINEDESTFPDYVRDGKTFVNVEESRYNLINFSFQLSDSNTGEEKIIEKSLFFPKMINKTYFYLNGSKFYPIFQIIDACTYNNGNSLTLKTLLMPIIIRTKKIEEYYDIFDNVYSGNIKIVDLFKRKINYLLYFFAEMGYDNAMKYLAGNNYEDYIVVCNKEEIDVDATAEDYNIFTTGSHDDTVLCIEKNFMKENDSFCLNLIEILNSHPIGEFNLHDKNNWVLELGKLFSRNKNNYESKALDILTSFKRILDNSTRNNLRLKEENKKDIFAIVRWMTKNFERLITRDNMDLKYKRIRIYEYLCWDLLIKMSNSTYRLLNKNEITMKEREQLFSTLGPMFIIKKIGQNELLRYMGGVNEINLFNPSLKFSFRGFQGLGSGSRDVNMEYRGVHPSYIGKIDLVASSSGDPGLTGTFVPFIKNYGFNFSDEMLD